MKRYPELSTSSPSAPYDAIIMDFIFLLQTTPMKGQTIMSYTQMLMQRHIVPRYKDGTTEIHLIFDKKCENGFNPKKVEQKRRDSNSLQPQTHTHLSDLSPCNVAPHPWREYINCRVCKHIIIETVGLSYMQTGAAVLRGTQKLVLGGCFGSDLAPDAAWVISANSLIPEPEPTYNSSAYEADCRLWRHARGTSFSKILLYSPDTDIYNIGLGFQALLQEKDITVKINLINKQERLLHLNSLVGCLNRDPELASLDAEKKGAILQTLFITSGCDYISYFSGHGKASFLKVFTSHAKFICGNNMPGCLSNTFQDQDNGFLAFLRLVGTLYFSRHHSAFSVHHQCETPQQLFSATHASDCSINNHNAWIDTIRGVVSERILSEEERMPSTSALRRHWDRTCWISKFWNNSILQDIQQGLPLPENSGWLKHSSNEYAIDWDSREVQERVQGTIEFLTKGCSCKKSKCQSSRCTCKQKDKLCGPACKCIDCLNKSRQGDNTEEDDNDDYSSEGDESEEIESEVVSMEEFDLLDIF